MPVLNWIGKDAGARHDAESWIRNVERKPGSFSLPASSDGFYPDFLVRMRNGGIIAAAYKAAHLASNPDSAEKKRIRGVWERRSGGRRAFAWIDHRGDWTPVMEAAIRCVTYPR